MKIFISWSGERSHALGQALRDWLPMVLQYVEPWLSQSDIQAGERWANEVGKELESSNFGIICITRDNITSPWILFEAGALSKSMQEGRVVPLLLDVEFKDITGPLAQFQAKKVEKAGLLEVVNSVNRFSEEKLADARLAPQFEALWATFEQALAALPKNAPHSKQNRPQHEILEELVSGIRGLDLRFRETQEEPPRVRRRRTRLNPMMMLDILRSSEFGPHDPIQFLVLASFVKDDFPWVYELGAEAYREAAQRPVKSRDARRRFFSAVKMLRHGPFTEMVEDKETFMLIRELEHLTMDVGVGVAVDADVDVGAPLPGVRLSGIRRRVTRQEDEKV